MGRRSDLLEKREIARMLKAEAKRLRRLARSRARRAAAMPDGAGHHTTADVPERAMAVCVGQQQAWEAEALL